MVGHRNRIAIIDDESDIAKLFSEGLEIAGFKTTAFDDPEDAIEYQFKSFKNCASNS
jgi:DNA-binding response OmpR family regulator